MKTIYWEIIIGVIYAIGIFIVKFVKTMTFTFLAILNQYVSLSTVRFNTGHHFHIAFFVFLWTNLYTPRRRTHSCHNDAGLRVWQRISIQMKINRRAGRRFVDLDKNNGKSKRNAIYTTEHRKMHMPKCSSHCSTLNYIYYADHWTVDEGKSRVVSCVVEMCLFFCVFLFASFILTAMALYTSHHTELLGCVRVVCSHIIWQSRIRRPSDTWNSNFYSVNRCKVFASGNAMWHTVATSVSVCVSGVSLAAASRTRFQSLNDIWKSRQQLNGGAWFELNCI